MGPDFLNSFTLYSRNTNSFNQSINTQTFCLLTFNVFLMLLFIFRPRMTTNIRKTRKKAADIDPKELHEMGGDGWYSVLRLHDVDRSYLVNTNVGLCTCPMGKTGFFCKHQHAIKTKYGAYCRTAAPVLSPEDCAKLYFIACGHNSDAYGASFTPIPTTSCTTSITTSTNTNIATTSSFTPPLDIDSLIQGIQDFSLHIITKLQTSPQTFTKETHKFLTTYEQLKSSDTGLAGALATFSSEAKQKYNRRYIKIGPRRASERVYGGGEASRAQTAGRKPNGFAEEPRKLKKQALGKGYKITFNYKYAVQRPAKKSCKRKHSIAEAQRNNVPVGGTHATGMLHTFLKANR